MNVKIGKGQLVMNVLDKRSNKYANYMPLSYLSMDMPLNPSRDSCWNEFIAYSEVCLLLINCQNELDIHFKTTYVDKMKLVSWILCNKHNRVYQNALITLTVRNCSKFQLCWHTTGVGMSVNVLVKCICISILTSNARPICKTYSCLHLRPWIEWVFAIQLY